MTATALPANAAHENLLAAITSDMARSQIAYCLLRNYEALPAQVDGDVDILLEPENLVSCLATIKNQCDSIGAFPIFFMRLSAHVQIHIYSPNAEINKRFLAIDLQTSLAYKNIAYLPAKDILANLGEHNGYSVPRPAFKLFCLIAHCVIDKNDFKEKYISQINQLLPSCADELLPLLVRTFGDNIARQLMKGLKDNDFHICLQQRSNIIKRLVSLKACLGYASYTWTLNRYRIQRLLHFPGIFSVLLGPDGSGKSTVSEALIQAFAAYPGKTLGIYLGSKRQTLPNNLLKKVGLTAPPPAANNFKKAIRDIMAVTYHCTRYTATYLIDIMPHLFRRGIVVGDRYYYDLFASGYYKLPNWLTGFIIKIMPAPHIVIFLENTPEVIFQRKPEISLLQIENQLERFRSVGSKVSGWRPVSTDAEVNEVVGKILNLMMERWRLPWSCIK